MDVLTPPNPTTTTGNPTPSRPLHWPGNADASGRRRDAGHGTRRNPVVPPPARRLPDPPATTDEPAPILRRRRLTPLVRARLALAATLFAAATATVALPPPGDAPSTATQRTTASATPTAPTATCSPIAVRCCDTTVTPTDIVRELRPACP